MDNVYRQVGDVTVEQGEMWIVFTGRLMMSLSCR